MASYTVPQLKLLKELNLKPGFDKRVAKKFNAHAIDQSKKFPKRSGNLETPVKPKHKGLMGQPDNPHGTRSDKLGRPPPKNVRSTPTTMDDPSGLEDLGDPITRGLSDGMVGNDAGMHPNSTKTKPQRLQGPAENPGAQKWTSFGNRYPGTRSVN